MKRIAKKWFKKAPPVGECKKAPSRHQLIYHLLSTFARHKDAQEKCRVYWHDAINDRDKRLRELRQEKNHAYEKQIRALTQSLDEANARVVLAKEQAALYQSMLS